MGFVSKYALLGKKELKIFTAPAILVARKGYAGTMNYVSRGTFTTNDDAYVIKTKTYWKDKINLKWFIYEYQELFYRLVTSKSDNATFSKEYAERQIIQIPSTDEQRVIAIKIEQIEQLLKKTKKYKKEIYELLEYSLT